VKHNQDILRYYFSKLHQADPELLTHLPMAIQGAIIGNMGFQDILSSTKALSNPRLTGSSGISTCSSNTEAPTHCHFFIRPGLTQNILLI